MRVARLPVIRLKTLVECSIEAAFDLSRSIDLHVESVASTSERAVAGRTSGLIELGETVTWEARHFGVRQRLTTKITMFDRPNHFRDTMVSGAFRRFDHDHYFRADEDATAMMDVFDYDAPLGPLGRLADWLFLQRYMRRLLERRNQYIQRIARQVDPLVAPPSRGMP